MLNESPVARGSDGQLVVSGHRAVTEVAHNSGLFSNAVSRRLQVPNGLDGDSHTEITRMLAPFFDPSVLDALEAALTVDARRLVGQVGAGGRVFDAVGELGQLFAVRAQSMWLGWQAELQQPLNDWVTAYRDASRGADPAARGEVAEAFDALVRSILDERREAHSCDVTSLLMSVRWDDGRRLSEEETVAILRNWTGGDLASIALCTGVLVHWLATHPECVAGLARADNTTLDAAIDEILRLDDPFVSNRRVATHDTHIAGCPVAQGEVVVLDWRAANMDPHAFEHPESFAPLEHAAANLVYGTGPHACPGRGLATRELRVMARTIMEVGSLELAGVAEREPAPLAGFRSIPVRIVAR